MERFRDARARRQPSGECSTNYAALVALRSNLDVQDMRRVLPPLLWMPEADLEPAANEEEGESYNHGAYPQRIKEFSVGAQENWGWLRHLGTTEYCAHDIVGVRNIYFRCFSVI